MKKLTTLSAIISSILTSNIYAQQPAYSLKDIDYFTQPTLLEIPNLPGSSLRGKSFTIRYKKTSNSIASLLSFSDTSKKADYLAFYAFNNTIGVEQQTNGDNNATKQQKHFKGNITANHEFNTVTYSISESGALTIYFNGEKIALDTQKGTFDTIPETYTNIKLGGLDRIDARTQKLTQAWEFNGDIYTLEVGNALDDAAARALHNKLKTTHEQESHSLLARNPDTMGVTTREPMPIFSPTSSDEQIPYWRIPSIVRTQDGVLIAAADKHYQNTWDWGAIQTAYRISRDDGKTWEDIQTLMGLATHHQGRPPHYDENADKFTPRKPSSNSAFLIDSVMVQDKNTNRIFLGIDMFPESLGLFRSGEEKNGNGYVNINGKPYLKLIKADGTIWTLRENGEVYDNSGQKTEYRVTTQGTQANHFKELGDIYQGEEKVGNIYLQAYGNNQHAPFIAQATSYFWITHSDDNGETWSSPIDINPQIKKDWMRFLGTGPGVGIQTQNGNLVMPVYYTNRNNRQSSALIISKDGGKTWELGQSPNDTRSPNSTENSQTLTDANKELTESQVVELSNGDLKLFMRNNSGKVRIATSKDGGYTWLPMEQRIDLNNIPGSKINELNNPYSQLSVIKFSKKINGKEYLIFSGPSVSASGGAQNRKDGKIFLGEVQENGEIKWFTASYKSIQSTGDSNGYVYSAMAELGDGSIGLLYETDINHTTIDFLSFDLQELFWKENKIFSDARANSARVFSYSGAKDIEKIGDGTAIKQGKGESLGNATVSEGTLILNQQADEQGKKLAYKTVTVKKDATIALGDDSQLDYSHLILEQGSKLDLYGNTITVANASNEDGKTGLRNGQINAHILNSKNEAATLVYGVNGETTINAPFGSNRTTDNTPNINLVYQPTTSDSHLIFNHHSRVNQLDIKQANITYKANTSHFSNQTNIETGATLALESGSTVVAQALTLANNAKITIDSSSNNPVGLYTETLSGGGNIIKNGNGNVQLSGNINLTGKIDIRAGSLQLNDANLNNSTLVLGNGTALAGSGTIKSHTIWSNNLTISPNLNGGTTSHHINARSAVQFTPKTLTFADVTNEGASITLSVNNHADDMQQWQHDQITIEGNFETTNAVPVNINLLGGKQGSSDTNHNGKYDLDEGISLIQVKGTGSTNQFVLNRAIDSSNTIYQLALVSFDKDLVPGNYYDYRLMTKLINAQGHEVKPLVSRATNIRAAVNSRIPSYLVANNALMTQGNALRDAFTANLWTKQKQGFYVLQQHNHSNYTSHLDFVDYGYDYKSTHNSTIFGGYLPINANAELHAGLAFSRQHVTPQAADGMSSARYNTTSALLALHNHWDNGLLWNTHLGYHHHRGHVSSEGVSQAAKVKGHQLQLGTEVGYNIALNSLVITPVAGINYQRLSLDIQDKVAKDWSVNTRPYHTLSQQIGSYLSWNGERVSMKIGAFYEHHHQKQQKVTLTDGQTYNRFNTSQLGNAMLFKASADIAILKQLKLGVQVEHRHSVSKAKLKQTNLAAKLAYEF